MRELKSAEDLQLELQLAALRLSVDSEGRVIDFERPTRADAEDSPIGHNWDVMVHCPEGLEEIAMKAVMEVAERWDLR